ncbi:MAG: site-2 protease family protein [bacterium]|nr:site-2 protease family protein [bacterium]
MNIIFSLLVLLFSAIIHEISHGYVAERLGDPTARLAGRLTLNPIKHIDPMMSVLLPLLLLFSGSPIIFGAAKPVPVDPFNLKEGRKDMALVALSGPLVNIILAILASILFRLLPLASSALPIFLTSILYVFLSTVITINLLLAIFNLLPIPPLDGSKVFSLILPEKEASLYLSLGSFGMFILFFLLLFPFGGFSLMNLVSNLLNFSLNLLLR